MFCSPKCRAAYWVEREDEDPSPRKRTLKNEPERRFEDWAQANGWRTTKRGWPDFLCYNDSTGEVMVVEVKPERDGRPKRLKREQAECLEALRKAGVPCFLSTGEGLIPVPHRS